MQSVRIPTFQHLIVFHAICGVLCCCCYLMFGFTAPLFAMLALFSPVTLFAIFFAWIRIDWNNKKICLVGVVRKVTLPWSEIKSARTAFVSGDLSVADFKKWGLMALLKREFYQLEILTRDGRCYRLEIPQGEVKRLDITFLARIKIDFNDLDAENE